MNRSFVKIVSWCRVKWICNLITAKRVKLSRIVVKLKFTEVLFIFHFFNLCIFHSQDGFVFFFAAVFTWSEYFGCVHAITDILQQSSYLKNVMVVSLDRNFSNVVYANECVNLHLWFTVKCSYQGLSKSYFCIAICMCHSLSMTYS